MTVRNNNLRKRYPPGFSVPRYRVTPEEIERNKRENRIQREKEERAWRELVEEGKVPAETEPHEKPA